MSARPVLLSLLIYLALSMPQAASSTPPKEGDGPRTDRYGDPLPAGAIARLGKVRLRHSNGVLALAFSPDGKTVAAGDADSRVSIWDVATGKELHRLPRVENQILPMVFSLDGKLLAFATYSGQIIYLHDAITGKQVRKLTLDSGGLHALTFSPDSKLLAWGSHDKAVHLWDVASAKEHRQLKGFESTIGFLSFTPEGKSLLVGSTDLAGSTSGTISQRDLRTGKELRGFKVDRDGAGVAVETSPHLAALSPDGKRLVSVAEDGSLCLWQLATGEEIWRVKKGDNQWNTLIYAPDSKSLAVAEWNKDKRVGVVKLLDAATGREFRRLQGVNGAIMRIVFSPDAKMMAIGGWDNCVRFFDPATGTELPGAGGHQGKINTVCFCRDGEWVVTGGWDGSFRIWETATGRELRRIDSSGERCCKAASFDGKHLILMEEPSPIRIWDVIGGKELRRREVPGKMPWKNSFSCTGETTVVDLRNEHVQIWNAMTGEVRREIDTRGLSTFQAILSPDGRTLAAGDMHDSARVWDVGSGKARRIKGVDGFVFSPDGKTLAFRGGEGVRLWETATGRERGGLRGGREALFLFAFSPDGRTLASGGKDGTVHLWHLATGRELASASAHRGWVNDLTFSPDGKRFVSAGDDTTALVWDLESMLPAEPPARKVTAEELQSLWADLASDAARAYRAIHTLNSAGSPAVRSLAERLRPPQLAKERKDIARFLANLDSDDFAVREAATSQLEKLGPWAEPHLRDRLKERPSLETRKRLERLLQRLDDQVKSEPQGETLRSLRALEALEHIGSAEARTVLEMLAKDTGDVRLMREAKASLTRLARRSRALQK